MRGWFTCALVLVIGCRDRVIDFGSEDGAASKVDATEYDSLVPETDPRNADAGTMAMEAGSDVLVADGAPPSVDITQCPCTRRPGPTQSPECPLGVDESASLVVGPGGGRLTLGGRQSAQQNTPDFEVELPPGALLYEVTVTVTETSLAPPAGYHDDSPVYRVGPADLAFVSSVKLVVPHGNTTNDYTRLGYLDAGSLDGQHVWVSYDEGSSWAVLRDFSPNPTSMLSSLSRGGLYFVGFRRRGIETLCP
jgi:hypothetical protein